MLLPVNMPNIGPSQGVGRLLSNTASIIKNRRDVEASKEAAADLRIFRKAQLANSDRIFNSNEKQLGITNAASQLAANRTQDNLVRDDNRADITQGNLKDYQDSLIAQQAATFTADEAWRNGGQSAQEAKDVAAQRQLLRDQNIEFTTARDSSKETSRIFGASDMPSNTNYGASPFEQEQAAADNANYREYINENPSLFQNKELIADQTRTALEAIGFSQAEVQQGVNHNTRIFTANSPENVALQQDLLKESFKAQNKVYEEGSGANNRGNSGSPGVSVSDSIATDKHAIFQGEQAGMQEGSQGWWDSLTDFNATGNGSVTDSNNLYRDDLQPILGQMMEMSAASGGELIDEVAAMKALVTGQVIGDKVWLKDRKALMQDVPGMMQLINSARSFKGAKAGKVFSPQSRVAGINKNLSDTLDKSDAIAAKGVPGTVTERESQNLYDNFIEEEALDRVNSRVKPKAYKAPPILGGGNPHALTLGGTGGNPNAISNGKLTGIEDLLKGLKPTPAQRGSAPIFGKSVSNGNAPSSNKLALKAEYDKLKSQTAGVRSKANSNNSLLDTFSSVGDVSKHRHAVRDAYVEYEFADNANRLPSLVKQHTRAKTADRNSVIEWSKISKDLKKDNYTSDQVDSIVEYMKRNKIGY